MNSHSSSKQARIYIHSPSFGPTVFLFPNHISIYFIYYALALEILIVGTPTLNYLQINI